MTNEEAVYWLTLHRDNTNWGSIDKTALDLAIEFLSQQSEDAISREKVMELLDWGWREGIYPQDKISALLSVTPKQMTGHWTWLRPDVVQCDDCRYIHTIMGDDDNRGINYCPSCGRKMEKRTWQV